MFGEQGHGRDPGSYLAHRRGGLAEVTHSQDATGPASNPIHQHRMLKTFRYIRPLNFGRR